LEGFIVFLVIVPLLVIAFWVSYFFLPPVHGLPILAYHRLSEWTNGKLTITVDKLDEQLETLKRQGYQSITFSDLKNLETTGRPLPNRPVLLTFDDDYLTVHRHAYPLLKKHRFQATVFLPHDSANNFSHLLGGERVLGYEGFKEMCADGIEFALRSQKLEVHQNGSPAQIESDIGDCVAALERTECPFVRVLAYPYGFRPNSRVGKTARRDALAKFSLDYAVRVGSGLNTFPLNKKYDLVRISIDGTDSLKQFERKVTRGKSAWL
jgi:peptidoglycan/xylan/chitin deacetylase (PgdA/CDA1 family)